MKNQGQPRHKLSLFWREQEGLSAAGAVLSTEEHLPVFPAVLFPRFPCSSLPLSGALKQSCHPKHTGCRWHWTAGTVQGVHRGCGRSAQLLRAGTTKSSAYPELLGWHFHIQNFAVPEKGLDLLRMIKCSASFPERLRHQRVETL